MKGILGKERESASKVHAFKKKLSCYLWNDQSYKAVNNLL